MNRKQKHLVKVTIAETSPNFREIPEEKERGEEIAKEFGTNGTRLRFGFR